MAVAIPQRAQSFAVHRFKPAQSPPYRPIKAANDASSQCKAGQNWSLSGCQQANRDLSRSVLIWKRDSRPRLTHSGRRAGL